MEEQPMAKYLEYKQIMISQSRGHINGVVM